MDIEYMINVCQMLQRTIKNKSEQKQTIYNRLCDYPDVPFTEHQDLLNALQSANNDIHRSYAELRRLRSQFRHRNTLQADTK